MKRKEIEDLDQLAAYGNDWRNLVLQGLDLRELDLDWKTLQAEGSVLLGCTLPELAIHHLLETKEALVFPRLENRPYKVYRPAAYTWLELLTGFDRPGDESTDRAIYDHFKAHQGQDHLVEELAQRIHDHAMDDVLGDHLVHRQVVGIMGGHSTRRDDPYYAHVAELARALTTAGYFVASGGGPGIMEAANLGAYLSAHDDAAIPAALRHLSRAPHYTNDDFTQRALEVREDFPAGAQSLAIPTWLYGHEPSNVFASHIIKYFSNSLREDALLTCTRHGIVFAPGGAGTTQEVFQDACQNHYHSLDVISPMVFLGTTYFMESGIYPTLLKQAQGRPYHDYLFLTDSPEEAVQFIQDHPPLQDESV